MGSAPGPVAFVLSGGATLGAAQAGMLHALLEAGIVPDLLVGTSIGAVNAAYLAASPTPEQTEALCAIWLGLTVNEFFPLNPARMIRAMLSGPALYSPDPLRRLLERELPYGRIEEAHTPLHIVATRFERRPEPGRSLRAVAKLDRTVERAALPLRAVARPGSRTEEVFHDGPVVDAVLASTALPLVFPPYQIDGQLYVDGGLSEYVPLGPALAAGAATVYVLSLGGFRARPGMVGSLRTRLWRRAGVTPRGEEGDRADVRVVVLPVPAAGIGLRDFARLGELMAAAYEAATRFLQDRPLGRSA